MLQLPLKGSDSAEKSVNAQLNSFPPIPYEPRFGVSNYSSYLNNGDFSAEKNTYYAKIFYMETKQKENHFWLFIVGLSKAVGFLNIRL